MIFALRAALNFSFSSVLPRASCHLHPRARSGYDEEVAYDDYMDPEPGFFLSCLGDSVDAD